MFLFPKSATIRYDVTCIRRKVSKAGYHMIPGNYSMWSVIWSAAYSRY